MNKDTPANGVDKHTSLQNLLKVESSLQKRLENLTTMLLVMWATTWSRMQLSATLKQEVWEIKSAVKDGGIS